MKRLFLLASLVLVLFSVTFARHGKSKESSIEKAPKQEQWTPEKANAWYIKQGWLVGCNYIPAYAINQLEMWQADTFDTLAIEKELALAESIGMNTLRVFLHDLLWLQDAAGFKKRIDKFLSISKQHHIKIVLVLFDSCWDPLPKLGKQKEPLKGVHNSGWVQSPGRYILENMDAFPYLEQYIKDIITTFAKDERVLLWDLFNEPDNDSFKTYGKLEAKEKSVLGFALLKKTFLWARAVNPSQPVCASIWSGDWSSHANMKEIDRFIVENSDVINFHLYTGPEEFSKQVGYLKRYNRPLFCTEYLARPIGSTFQNILPLAKQNNVAAYNWGFMEGKIQTAYPWDSWDKPYDHEPIVWFHDIFRKDGSPYSQSEVEFIKQITGKDK